MKNCRIHECINISPTWENIRSVNGGNVFIRFCARIIEDIRIGSHNKKVTTEIYKI